jgi:hypothetical protein
MIDGNPVAFWRRSNLSLTRNNGVHTGGDVLNGNVGTTARPVAVQGVFATGELKDGLTHRLAVDSAGMSAFASLYDGAFLARWVTADYNVVFGLTHLAGLRSGLPSVAVANGECLTGVASGPARSTSSVVAAAIAFSFAALIQFAAQVPQKMFCVHVSSDELDALTHHFRQNGFAISVNGCHLDQLNDAPPRVPRVARFHPTQLELRRPGTD